MRPLRATSCAALLAASSALVSPYVGCAGKRGRLTSAALGEAAGAEEAGKPYGQKGWFAVGAEQEKSYLELPPQNPAVPGSVYTPHYENSTEPAGIQASDPGVEPPDAKKFWSERRRQLESYAEYDEVWISMRREAKSAAKMEPLLVSFLYATILNQNSLEEALAFQMANKLAGPRLIGTQVQGLFKECLQSCPSFRRSLRRDILAVRERDPACESYVDPLLYFKGFQALQAHRVAHWLYGRGRIGLACYLQSRVSQEFQIDIHPAAVIGEGVFIDHGTGIVIGETTQIGDDCSILHQVTLGGSGLMHETRRHPKVGRSVLIGAGACLLGGILVGDGVQIGACSLVLEDIPEHTVAVGVPAKVRGYLKGRSPAEDMQQDMSDLFVEVWKGMDI